jgi:TetR/AcrR family transcriptional regulator, regulator of autoinduction and epiphytic fitness
VIDALVELFHDGVYEPGSALIAERAGLSPRSLFRYFDDVDDLTHAAIDRFMGEARPLVDLGIGDGAPLAVRIERLVDSRLRLYDAIAPGARAARICAHRNKAVAKQIHDSRRYLRGQIGHLFAPESPDVGALDALCSFETYELLREHQSKQKVRATLIDALTALL